ncbi:MAG: hypothetical protein RL685_1565 [Pseudomonadota bacterium]|jgi:hypothetical protein
MSDTLHGDPELVKVLGAMGFQHVVLRICKVVRGKRGECAMPGATAMASYEEIAPCLRMEAAELRSIADGMDREFERLAPRTEADRGYVETVDPKEYGL